VARTYLLVAALSLCLFNLCRANAQTTTAPTSTTQLPKTVQARTVVLRGGVIAPTGFLADSSVTIAGSKIVQLGGTVPTGANVVETDSFIFPGLIDLHNHITWNFLPRWKPNELFANRYEWQQRQAYKIALDAPHRGVLNEPGMACDAERYGEVKVMVGGATSTVGSLGSPCIMGLARNLDNYSGFGPPGVLNHEKLRYEVFPFELGLADAKQIRADLDSGTTLKAFLIHVGEGKPTDAASAREFAMLVKHDDGFLRRGVSIIHGVALGKSEFDKMAKNEMGLIWSPRSNIELYGATTDVRSAKAAGVRIALAPDWSPSGSDGVIEELKYAATWNAAQPSPADPTKFGLFTDKELVQMVTVTPALLAAVDQEIGSLEPGRYADLLLIRKSGSDPYQALIHASPADVRLVIINGVPLYGDADLMEKLSPRRAIEIISVCGRQKALYMDPQSGVPETLKSFKQISQELETALNLWGGSLSPLAICDGTNLH
jgi:5-methylthioadenosine/S-adenosylhomocysteine deaminase